ncbi:MAG: hypothetical protein C5B60_04400 [Chloroflexi bacterium]|nr:MAG: hypothetical protein C5B60_04400 [Chloroflexota bacterium]
MVARLANRREFGISEILPVPLLVRRLFGRLFGDKGYLSMPLAEHLFLSQGLRLITKLRKNMRNVLMPVPDKLLLRKRALTLDHH